MSTSKKFYDLEELEKEHGKLVFGKLLESQRLCAEMSQKEFAGLLKISPSSLCDLEKGRRLPSLKRTRKIAKMLKHSEIVFVEVTIQDYLEREGPGNVNVSLTA